MSVAITLRLFGQIVTRLAAQCNFALKSLTLQAFLMEHILYATMDQEGITQHGHTIKDPLAVTAQKMTGVLTISAVSITKTFHRIKVEAFVLSWWLFSRELRQTNSLLF